MVAGFSFHITINRLNFEIVSGIQKLYSLIQKAEANPLPKNGIEFASRELR